MHRNKKQNTKMKDESNNSKPSAQIHSKAGREFLLCPLFKHDDHQQQNQRKQQKQPAQTDQKKQYQRKVIDRIVTSLPLSSFDNDKGDIEVSLEEYYHRNSNPYANSGSTGSISSTSNRQNASTTIPILRRVAIRSYIGQSEGSTRGDDGDDDGLGMIIHASFALPIGPLPRNNNTRLENNEVEKDSPTNLKLKTIPAKNWICWTKFASSSSQYSYGTSRNSSCNNNDDHDHNNDDYSGSDDANVKTQLCVLTGPRTLKIYDIYPNPPTKSSSSSSNHNSNHTNNNHGNSFNGMSKTDGHTISLPFEASSIFALPSPYYGLLIQRADNGDEENFMTHDDFVFESNQSNNNMMINIQQQQPQVHQVDDANNNDDDENVTMNSPSPKDDFVIEGPPSTVRLGINHHHDHPKQRLQPPPSDPSPQILQKDGTTSPTPSYASSEFGVVVVNHTETMNKLPMVPSLYTLHHPLDEIVPCMFTPTMDNCINNNGNTNNTKNADERKQQPSMWRKSSNNNINMNNYPSSCHYANVFERVIYVGKPRNFRSKDQVVIVITYHTKKKRHSVWTINAAPKSMANIPLWKQTSMAFHNDNMNTISGDNDVMMMMGENKMNDNDQYLHQSSLQNNMFPFDELNARVSLRCIHMLDDPVKIKDDSNGMTSSLLERAIESVASRVFLATSPTEDGDFLLCFLQGLSTNPNVKNKNLLRCFTLQHKKIESNRKNSTPTIETTWIVTHSNDTECVSALPISSTPINPPSFDPFESSKDVKDIAIEWRRKYSLEPPLARDIFVFKYNDNKEKLSLFRGDVKIANCLLPTSTQDIFQERSLSVSNLQYAVGDRVDILYNSDDNESIAVRVALSLITKSSPVTEQSLLSIGSAILSPLSCNIVSPVKSSMPNLIFAFRADCAISTQLASLFPEAQELVDDLEWYVFSSLISSFFAFALNKSATWESLSSLEADMEDTLDVDEKNDDEAWNSLLRSEFHMQYYDLNSESMLLKSSVNENLDSNPTKDNLREKLIQSFVASACVHWLSNNVEEDESLNLVCAKIFDALHLLYEELKVGNSSACKSDIHHLGNLLLHLSSRCVNLTSDGNNVKLMGDFEQMYRSDLWNSMKVTQSAFPDVFFSQRVTMFDSPPSFYEMLDTMIRDETTQTNFWQHANDQIVVNGICVTMGTVLRLFSIHLDNKSENEPSDDIKRYHLLIMAIVSEGFNKTNEFIQKLPLAISYILMEACHKYRSNLPPISKKYASSFYEFLERTDLARTQDQFFPVQGACKSIGNRHSAAASKDNSMVTQTFSNDEDEDGLGLVEKFSAMSFPNDNRVREAAKLLRSSKPTFLRVPRPVEISDHDYERQKQEKLSLLCRRVVALSIGRGMLTYGTLQSLPAEQLPVPPLCLAGRIPPRNATLSLEGSQWTQDMKMWPEFHNGVAAALRLGANDDGPFDVARTWIVYNKPPQNQTENSQNNNSNNTNQTQIPPQHNNAHGGFLMGLGLRGHLSALSMIDVCDYLASGAVSIPTVVGLLLGLAANKRETCDPSVSKMLCIHTLSLLPSSYSSSIDVRSPQQVAAIAGIGLLYQKSSHRLMTEFLLNEIGKRPTNEQHISDRESYSLCCGVAVGMINLGLRSDKVRNKKKKFDDLSDVRIEDRLLRYIIGGLDESHIKQKNEQLNNMNSNNANDSERCSRIYEGDLINTDVTTPGALLALGLMYVQSG